jgi:L-seryl-tRNA(Ser) seleniumtransferase
MDVASMDRLPDTSGMRDEVVVQRGHRNAYDHAIRAVGVKLVEVGYLGYPGAGGTWAWQLEAALSERTAAVACPILDTPGTLSLPAVCEIAHARGVPVVVDAAAALPPRANLRRFIAEGADLVTFSGGKAVAGPQASGILAGRADLIASVALQHQDMDVRLETWAQRPLVADRTLAGIPHQGFGRSMKVGREEIAGLIAALQRYAAGSDDEDELRWSAMLRSIEHEIAGIPAVNVVLECNPRQPVPRLTIELDSERFGADAYHIVNALLTGEPAIAVDQSRAEFGRIAVDPRGLSGAEAEIVGRRLREVLGAGD